MTSDFRPTASIERLRQRAVLLRAARSFFDERGYWEVQTPLLSSQIVVDAWLDPFVCQWHPQPMGVHGERDKGKGTPCYLQTSPELGMKRLLAAGADAIYQLGAVFRNGEFGARHNPEFTMLEWYRTGDNHLAQMSLVESFVRSLLAVAQKFSSPAIELSERPFRRLSYDNAFREILGISALNATVPELEHVAANLGLVAPPGLAANDRDGWLNWLLAEKIEPILGFGTPVFLHEYPASLAALARTRIDQRTSHPVAARFELYINGVELCNGYHELLEANVLRERIMIENAKRLQAGISALPETTLLLAAMEAGLPPCAGVALGFDRLVQLLLGADQLSEVIAFPFDRA